MNNIWLNYTKAVHINFNELLLSHPCDTVKELFEGVHEVIRNVHDESPIERGYVGASVDLSFECFWYVWNPNSPLATLRKFPGMTAPFFVDKKLPRWTMILWHSDISTPNFHVVDKRRTHVHFHGFNW